MGKGATVKILFLLRHAKSDWGDDSQPDFERPLNPRGDRDSKAVGAYLMQKSTKPDLILSSSATRARETTENLVTSSGLPTEVRFDQRIYEANREQLLEVIAEIESSVESVLMVGHNPGIEALLHFVTGKLEAVPTATLAKVQLKITSWRDVAARVGTLEWIVRPKEDLN